MIRLQVACIEGRQLNMIVNHDPVTVNGDTINRHAFKDCIRLSVIAAKIQRFSETKSLIQQYRLEVTTQFVFAVAVIVERGNGDFDKSIHLRCRSTISNWIDDTGFQESFESQLARIAFAAGDSIRIRIVATVSESVVNSQTHTLPNDFGFGQ